MATLSEYLMIGTSVLTLGINYGVIRTTVDAIKKTHDDFKETHDEFKGVVTKDMQEIQNKLTEKYALLGELRIALVGMTGNNGLIGNLRELTERIKTVEAEINALRERRGN